MRRDPASLDADDDLFDAPRGAFEDGAQPEAEDDSEAEAPRSRRLRIGPIATILTGSLLFVLILSNSLAAYLADVAPNAALWVSPNYPAALLKIAEQKLRTATEPEAKRSGRAIATEEGSTTSLERDPGSSVGTSSRSSDKPESKEDAKPETAEPRPPSELALLQSVSGLEPDEAAEIARLAEKALAREPLSARGLRMLGQAVAVKGEIDRAMQLMELAARVSIREHIAVYIMFLRSFEQKDYDRSLSYADALMRTRPELANAISPALAKLAEDPGASPLLKKQLAGNPPWRSSFLALMTKGITDARTPLDLLLSLKASGAPPTPQELNAYLSFLLSRGLEDLAYATWLQFLPADQLAVAGYLFNGNFEFAPSGMPFDWTIRQGYGATIGIGSRPDADGNKGLRIEFGAGRVDLGEISQRLMLPPGAYVLSFRHRGEVTGRRGLKWVVTCARPPAKVLGETPMLLGVQRQWKSSDIELTVPATDCPSQFLRLTHDARSSSEKFVSGLVWYDDIAIQRK